MCDLTEERLRQIIREELFRFKKSLEVPITPPANKTKGKTNVRVYQDIIIERGTGQHPADLVDEAERRGIRFIGVSSKPRQVRNSLRGSNRFINSGGNNWWVASTYAP